LRLLHRAKYLGHCLHPENGLFQFSIELKKYSNEMGEQLALTGVLNCRVTAMKFALVCCCTINEASSNPFRFSANIVAQIPIPLTQTAAATSNVKEMVMLGLMTWPLRRS
jgi:hypothetical protein